MTFLSAGMLAGLALVALPVLLHLLNRGRTKTVEWGAMDFLMRSIALRNRRIRLEEAMLLALRCLLLALLALAMAQPFLPSRGNLPAVLLMAAFAAAAVCVGIAGATWEHRRARHGLLIAAAVLVTLGVGGAVAERWLQTGWWAFDGSPRDLAIIVDGSTAMTLPYSDERTYFAQAMEEAEGLADALRPGDTVCVFIGGAAPMPIVGYPTSDKRELVTSFNNAPTTPPGDRFAGTETLSAAVTALGRGRNPQKTIVVIGAGHRGGLSPDQKAQWDFLEARMAELLPVQPDLLYRRLVPEQARDVRNIAISAPVLSRRLADTARPIRIEADIINSGTVAASPRAIELFIDDEKVDERTMAAELQPGVTETVTFTHHFTAAGPHSISVSVTAADDIAVDNRAVRVVHVENELPVLIVDGAPSSRRLRSASSYLNLAMNPAQDRRTSFRGRARFTAFSDTESSDNEMALPSNQHNLVKTTVIPLTDLASIADLDEYRVVVLVNVPRMPDAFTARLAEAVRGGMGLWIVPGHLTEPQQFERWRSPAGEPLWPAAPFERIALGRKPMPVQLQSFTHPAQAVFAFDPHSDAESLRIQNYWRLMLDSNDPNVRTAGGLLTGEPFMVERTFGKGSIILYTLMLDREDSNLPSLKSFVPLAHETLYYLASSNVHDDNTSLAREFSTVIAFAPPASDSTVPATELPSNAQAKVTTPSGRDTTAQVTIADDGVDVVARDTSEPGLYRIELPEPFAGRVSSRRADGGVLSFAVQADPRGAVVEPITESDQRVLNERVKFFLADSPDDLTMVLDEEVPGSPLWSWFMLAAMVVLLSELAASRLISMGRHNETAAPLEFDAGTSDASDFKDRVKEWFPNAKV